MNIKGSNTGLVKFFKKNSGFGFIINDEDEKDLFVHVKGCNSPIDKGDHVTFDVEDTPKGKCAVNVSIMKDI